MKKIIFTLAAVLASISAFAQTSLKYNGKFELAGMEVSNKDASGTGIAFHTIHEVDKDDMSSTMGGPTQTVKSKYNYDGVTVGLIFSIH